MEPVHVLFGIDRSYIPQLGVALESVLRVTSSQVVAHIVHDGIDGHDRKLIERLADGRGICLWYEMTDQAILGLEASLDHISRATYFRLAADLLLPETVSRVIYLDVDLIVQEDVRELWEVDLAGMPLGAVADPGGSASEFALLHQLVGQGSYFNAGVLLFDLASIRSTNHLQKARDLVLSMKFEYADQDALNYCFWSMWSEIGPRWNFQRKMLFDLSTRYLKPAIVHFSDAQKPWQASEWHPHAWHYLRSLRRTPFDRQMRAAGGIGAACALRWWFRWRRHEAARRLQSKDQRSQPVDR